MFFTLTATCVCNNPPTLAIRIALLFGVTSLKMTLNKIIWYMFKCSTLLAVNGTYLIGANLTDAQRMGVNRA